MVGHGGSSAGSYLADPTSPIPSHCASIVVTSTLRVKKWSINHDDFGDGAGEIGMWYKINAQKLKHEETSSSLSCKQDKNEINNMITVHPSSVMTVPSSKAEHMCNHYMDYVYL